MDKDTRLKLAVQKSGRLTDPCLDLLTRCGLKLSRGRDQLMGYGENLPLDVLFVRDDDIPDLVQQDVCDLGLVGNNVLEETRLELIAHDIVARFQPLRELDFGRCRLAIAVPDGRSYESPRSLQGKRIATTYPRTLERYLRERDVQAEIVTLSGSVEIAPRIGRSDFICDLVSTGSTLQANHLHEVETVLQSHAVLIRTPV
ncbi:MAG: ATP phosphoribosyltransferase, partial [Pseudomonadales bacterium]|nr:ATP phosphoribosyltransferase [Pseudomonadales bacterium]